MKTTKQKTMRITGPEQRAALASPLRLEIMGLFTSPEPLAIAEMAQLMGRTAGSLYHHVGILERAGLLRRAGTRPAGKRHEALFDRTVTRLELATSDGDADSNDFVVKSLASAFRMAERDLAAALHSPHSRGEGPGRNVFATRMHLRASPKLLAKVNKHLKAIEDLVTAEAAEPSPLSPTDEHLSLTLALLPLKGRGRDSNNEGE